MIQDKSLSFGDGTSSVMKQLAVASATAVGLNASAVTMGKYERQFSGASFEFDSKRFWFIGKSAHVQLIYETIPVGGGKSTTVNCWEEQMPQQAGPSSSSSSPEK